MTQRDMKLRIWVPLFQALLAIVLHVVGVVSGPTVFTDSPPSTNTATEVSCAINAPATVAAIVISNATEDLPSFRGESLALFVALILVVWYVFTRELDKRLDGSISLRHKVLSDIVLSCFGLVCLVAGIGLYSQEGIFGFGLFGWCLMAFTVCVADLVVRVRNRRSNYIDSPKG